MAQHTCLSYHSRAASFPRVFRAELSRAPSLITVLAAIFLGSASAHAQSQQQYVYASVPVGSASVVGGFSKDNTGSLAGAAGSPFADAQQGGLVAVDALGRFVFVLNAASDDISMFGINPDGSLSVVPGSPFAAGPTVNPAITPNAPLCLATESTGQFLYVGYRNGNYPQEGAILNYWIDQGSPLAPAPIAFASTDVPAIPIGIVTSPQGYLYAAFNLVPDSTQASPLQGIYVYSINPQNGQLTLIPNGASANPEEQTIAVDPQGRFLFDGWGDADAPYIEGAPILSDGTAIPSQPAVNISSSGSFPIAMLVESSGQFLYVQEGSNVAGYAINQSNGGLSPIQLPPTALSFRNGSAAADPMGPYIYSLQAGGYVYAFAIDLGSGALSEVSGSPYLVASSTGASGLAISGAPVQAATGLAASLAPPSQDFGQITLGQSSGTRIIRLTNTGGEVFSANTFLVTGANASDFISTPNCAAPLTPRASCTISMVFQPTAVGSRQAILTVTDAAGSQTSQLTGTGVAAEPAVTLVPGILTFPSTAQGATSPPQTVTITNSGSATLHVSSILPSGADLSDFSIAMNACTGAVAANASCTLSVVFSPLGDGLRSASLTISDDAPGSPQSVELTGTGFGPSVPRSAVTVAPTLLSFGTVMQGASSASQTITLTSSGAAPLHFSSITLAGANPADFGMTNGCAVPAYNVGASCTIGVTFTPLTTGPLATTLTIVDDAPNSPQTVAISGTASPNPNPTLTVTGTLSASVTAGQTATYNLQLVADFSGSIMFACTGAPATAICTTTPSPLKVTSGTPAAFAVNVATAAAGMTALTWSRPRLPPFAALRVLQSLAPYAIFAVILLLCSARRTRWLHLSTVEALRRWGAACCAPTWRRIIASGAVAALAIAALFAVAGCGGGTVAENAQVPVTPAQTMFTITVTPSGNSANGTPVGNLQPIQLTLIVN